MKKYKFKKYQDLSPLQKRICKIVGGYEKLKRLAIKENECLERHSLEILINSF